MMAMDTHGAAGTGSRGTAAALAGGLSSAEPVALRAVRPLTAGEFRRFRDLIYREAGIHLADCKEALLVGRLGRRIRELGLPSFSAYYDRVGDGGDVAERIRMLDAICTHETHFFREPRHFEHLEHTVFPRWKADADAGRRTRRVRVWSAACSSGEEPFTLAMLLMEHLPAREGWEVEVLATDLSTRVLERARAGLWPIARAAEIPQRLLKKYMLRGTRSQEGLMAASSELRACVRFGRVNLNDATYPVAGRFDLVFCRNVLIYFDAASRQGVVERLLDHVVPGGLFFLGHAETLNSVTARARVVIPTVYTPVTAPAARAA
jgi:chemotaxis protein methyltransferase CheR